MKSINEIEPSELLEIIKSGAQAWQKWLIENEINNLYTRSRLLPPLVYVSSSEINSDPDFDPDEERRPNFAPLNTDFDFDLDVMEARKSFKVLSELDLSGLNLKEFDLGFFDFIGENLEKAKPEETNPTGLFDYNFKGVNLEGANLSGADLTGANLERVNLKKANLKGTNLVGANLEGANLSGANIRGHLKAANFRNAMLCEADLSFFDLRETKLAGANLYKANLYEANLTAADLKGVCLTEVNLYNANLSEANLFGANLEGVNLKSTNLRGTNLEEADLTRADLEKVDLTEKNLTGACLVGANLAGANLAGANLKRADLTQADLSEADLTGANMRKSSLICSILAHTNLSNADLTDAFLLGANFISTSIENSIFDGCNIYGISVWDLIGEPASQNNLIITNQFEPDVNPIITVDDIEVAQFIYLMLNNNKIRKVLTTITGKGVLILGRFSPERKNILDAIRNKLRELDYVPMMFDFEQVKSRDYTETIQILAGMSRFVIADITSPKSSPLELQATVPNFKIPLIPIIQEDEHAFAMFSDLKGKYKWVLEELKYKSEVDLIKAFQKGIIDRAIEKEKELFKEKEKPIFDEDVKDDRPSTSDYF